MKTRNTDLGFLMLRISLGITMLFYGFSKLILGATFIEEHLISLGLPGFLYYGVFVGEILAPLLIVVGWRTRLAALIYAFNMLCALLLMKTGDILALNNNGGWAIDMIVLYILGGMALYFTGAGRFALGTKNQWD
ncbi:MAG TPA: DoxX family protein [Bacteroidetes bacterium]|nr:DoxX family protein [Bacteroidota bacterium]